MFQRFFSCLLACLLTQVLTAQSIALHPENPHYFLYRNKPAVLISSGEHYGALLNLDFGYKTYFDELKRNKLNLTRTFSGVYCEPPGAFNIAHNTLAPLANKYITPWARSESPGYINGGNKFDLGKWDENYFKRLKDFVAEAASRNIIVEFTLFCPFYEDTMWIFSPMHPSNNINSTPDIPRTDVYTLDKNGVLLDIQKTLVRKLVTELNSFDNVMFEICNEPYFGGITMEWQFAIADVIIETESGLPKKHLVTQNIANGSSIISDPHPGVSVFNFHYAYPPVTVAYNYALNKPIGDNETGFRGNTDSAYRFEGWRFMMAGGALYNNLDYSFIAGNEKGGFRYPSTQPGGGSDFLRDQLGYLKKFVESFDFIKMKPDGLLIDQPSNIKYNAISEMGKQYAIYFVDDSTSTITLNIPPGKYKIQWLDPHYGIFERPSWKVNVGDKMTLQMPNHSGDIALKILRVK